MLPNLQQPANLAKEYMADTHTKQTKTKKTHTFVAVGIRKRRDPPVNCHISNGWTSHLLFFAVVKTKEHQQSLAFPCCTHLLQITSSTYRNNKKEVSFVFQLDCMVLMAPPFLQPMHCHPNNAMQIGKQQKPSSPFQLKPCTAIKTMQCNLKILCPPVHQGNCIFLTNP